MWIRCETPSCRKRTERIFGYPYRRRRDDDVNTAAAAAALHVHHTHTLYTKRHRERALSVRAASRGKTTIIYAPHNGHDDRNILNTTCLEDQTNNNLNLLSNAHGSVSRHIRPRLYHRREDHRIIRSHDLTSDVCLYMHHTCVCIVYVAHMRDIFMRGLGAELT